MPAAPSPRPPGEITQTLAALHGGDAAAADRLWAIVYERLHILARRYRVSDDDILHRTTDVVHAAWETLARQRRGLPHDGTHLLALACVGMRRAATSWARAAARQAKLRGGGAPPETAAAAIPYADLLDLEEALVALERLKPRCVRVVEMRYFAGLSFTEIAHELGVSQRTAEADWAFARAWLHRRIGEKA